MTCQLNLVSFEKNIFSGLVKKIHISTHEGELGIYPGHSPLLARIKMGLIYLMHDSEQEEYMYISGGILEVQPDIITILADVVILALDLNFNLIIQQKKIAKENINKEISNAKNVVYINQLNEALAKLRVCQMTEKLNLK
ncbi:ATP synthase F1 subunit epsilon [Buchnera aphidicola (Formosaphis micheliae)]|uniref:ATP synthase F1 subunit epsilon n=1 Tax=Buchnera aphidicola TaxID=9 RepID=UPI0031B89267